MPLFKVSLRQAHDATWPNRRKWSNTFYLDLANPGQAAAYVAGLWVTVFRNAVDNSVFAYEVYATDMTPGTDNFSTVGIPAGQQRGLRGSPDGEKYLSKACLGVTLSAVSGRPSRKFWRFGLHEADVVDGASVNPAVVTLVTSWMNEALQEFATKFYDPDGEQLQAVQKVTLTTREFGRYAGNDVPIPPAEG